MENPQNRFSGTAASWLPDLEQSFQARSYRFDRDLRRVNDFSRLDFQGEQSNLIAFSISLPIAIKDYLYWRRSFSDGIATDKECWKI